MKALILAAGLGSRLAPITNNVPKSMVPVNGKPIIFKQIENLLENGVNEIFVVTGYKGSVLEQAVSQKFPNVKFIRNDNYDKTNNMYSAFLGSRYVSGDCFLMMNADVFYDASVVTSLLVFEADDAIVVDIGKYSEESMKVVECNGRIIDIAKTIQEDNALGNSIDVYKFSGATGEKFFSKCMEYIDSGDLNKWSEVALAGILQDCNFKACPLNGRWFEIDNHEDLKAAEELFKE